MKTGLRFRLVGAALCAGIFPLLWAVSGQGAEPGDPGAASEQVRLTSEKIRGILEDPALRGADHAGARLGKIREALDERFDWPRISRWVLARNMRKFNDEQFKEFTDLFSRYVVLYYMVKVEDFISKDDKEEDFDGEVDITYGEGNKRRDGSVMVAVTFTIPGGKEINTAYTLVDEDGDGDWKVRNFVVEGVSLVSNWRTELSYLGGRKKILSVMRKKVEGLEKKQPGGE